MNSEKFPIQTDVKRSTAVDVAISHTTKIVFYMKSSPRVFPSL
jgi:hypothetical protein